MDFTHFNDQGRAKMVDVGEKAPTRRTATAAARVLVNENTFALIRSGGMKKGDVLGVARVAGIMAAKRAWELIPLCHPLMLEHCTLDFTLDRERSALEAECTVKVSGRTGVEMEALTGVSAALLTVYDMCKAMDRSMVLGEIRLVHQEGGKSGTFHREE